jgi:hypothetical protein
MNRTARGLIIAFLAAVFFLVALKIWLEQSVPPRPADTSTPTPENMITATFMPTPTPTSTNTFFVAHINFDSPCRLGTGDSYDLVTKLEQGKDVWAIGKDSVQGTWLLVRPAGFPDCWVQGIFVTAPEIDRLEIHPTPPPFTATLNPTSTPEVTDTPTPTATRTLIPFTPTRTRQPPDDEPPPVTGPSDTPVPVEPKDPSPKHTPKPPSETPVPSPTPCPTNPGGNLPPGQCR